ncbi:unnamed protein product [Rhodiola kirilowii]
MQNEITAVQENDTWDIVDLLVGKHTIGCKWVYKIKRHSDGTRDAHFQTEPKNRTRIDQILWVGPRPDRKILFQSGPRSILFRNFGPSVRTVKLKVFGPIRSEFS